MTNHTESDAMRRKLIRPYWFASKAMLLQANFFGWAHFLLGIAATLVTSLVAAKPPFLGDHPDAILGDLKWAAVFLTSLLTLLNARETARRYAAAQRHLHDAIIQYRGDPSFDLTKVMAARHRAAAMIHGSSTTSVPSEDTTK